MKLNIKTGIGEAIFGMKEQDVQKVYGEPDKKYRDDDKNVIYIYNRQKLRLTFYEEEGFKLGYIISSNRDLKLSGENFIGNSWENVERIANDKGIINFEMESFDSVDNYFNEHNWLIFQVEFNEVIRVELGAIINNKDEFDWKFKI